MEQSVFPPTSKTTLRRKNFKESELSAMLELVGMYKDILEGKITDQVSNANVSMLKDKYRVWCIIEQKFNESSGVYHWDAKILKSKYEKLKKVSNKTFSDFQRTGNMCMVLLKDCPSIRISLTLI